MRRERRKDEKGAIAIIAAALMAFVLVLAALTVDIGLAYSTKRQSQTAADAAVLAATAYYVDSKVTCGKLDDNPSLNIAAKAEADKILQLNLPGAVGTNWAWLSRDNPEKELRVSYTATYESPLTLGQIVSDSDHVTVGTSAEATFDRAVRGESGLRPWPICSNSFDVDAKTVTQIVAGVKVDVGCPGLAASGTWGRRNCPGYHGGDMSGYTKPSSTLYWIRYGCTNSASPIPDQPESATAAALRDYLVKYAECAALKKTDSSTEFCLTRDTGSSRDNPKMIEAWQFAIDDGLDNRVAGPLCGPDMRSH